MEYSRTGHPIAAEKRCDMDKSVYRLFQRNELSGKNYTEIRLGKQRKKAFNDSSIYFTKPVFAMLEGSIWAKYREYSPGRAIAIANDEWRRILDEFADVIRTIESTNDATELLDLLGFRTHDELPVHQDFKIFKQEILSLYQGFSDWLNKHLETERYITICG